MRTIEEIKNDIKHIKSEIDEKNNIYKNLLKELDVRISEGIYINKWDDDIYSIIKISDNLYFFECKGLSEDTIRDFAFDFVYTITGNSDTSYLIYGKPFVIGYNTSFFSGYIEINQFDNIKKISKFKNSSYKTYKDFFHVAINPEDNEQIDDSNSLKNIYDEDTRFQECVDIICSKHYKDREVSSIYTSISFENIKLCIMSDIKIGRKYQKMKPSELLKKIIKEK